MKLINKQDTHDDIASVHINGAKVIRVDLSKIFVEDADGLEKVSSFCCLGVGNQSSILELLDISLWIGYEVNAGSEPHALVFNLTYIIYLSHGPVVDIFGQNKHLNANK